MRGMANLIVRSLRSSRSSYLQRHAFSELPGIDIHGLKKVEELQGVKPPLVGLHLAEVALGFLQAFPESFLSQAPIFARLP